MQYTIYNTGNVAALEVEITDNSFHPDHFTHVSGELNARIDRVPPYTNVSHTVVVRPRKYGYFNFTSAEVLYRRKEDATRLQVAVSSEPGEGLIVAYRDYDKQFSSHVVSVNHMSNVVQTLLQETEYLRKYRFSSILKIMNVGKSQSLYLVSIFFFFQFFFQFIYVSYEIKYLGARI